MVIRKVNITPPRPSGPPSPVSGPMPAFVPPMLRRFWSFIDKMRQRFNKELSHTGKDHKEGLTEAAVEEVTGQKLKKRR